MKNATKYQRIGAIFQMTKTNFLPFVYTNDITGHHYILQASCHLKQFFLTLLTFLTQFKVKISEIVQSYSSCTENNEQYNKIIILNKDMTGKKYKQVICPKSNM